MQNLIEPNYNQSVPVSVNTKKTIANTNTPILLVNLKRLFAIFVNDSNEDIYLSLSDTAAMNEGNRLNAGGGSLEINLNNLYTGAVSGICLSGGKNLTVIEGGG